MVPVCVCVCFKTWQDMIFGFDLCTFFILAFDVLCVCASKSSKIFNLSSGPVELEALSGPSQNYVTLMMLIIIFKLFLSKITNIEKFQQFVHDEY